MLGGVEQQDRLGTVAIDPRADSEPDRHCFQSLDPAHDPRAFSKIDEHDIIGRFGQARVDQRRRIYGAVAARLNPLPRFIAGARLGGTRREKAGPARFPTLRRVPCAKPMAGARGRQMSPPDAVIAGAATFGIGECPGYTSLEMAAQAALAALDDAAIALGAIDGHHFGTTREQLAAVAVAARQWANSNPEAFAQGELTVDDCLASRMISDPLSRSDCCLVTDGAAAIVLTRADRGRDARRPSVRLLGAAAATTHHQISAMPDLTRTAAAQSGPRAFAQAGLGPADVDVVQLYDAFTINTVLFLEDLGFCAKGEGGPFVASGAIAPGGSLPVNTNGGGLSCVHPGMYGLFALVEGVRQLRGDAANPIAGAEVALVHTNGGTLSSQATAILGRAA
jgi:hypothetical protein